MKIKILFTIVASIALLATVNATDDPHGSTDSIYCEQCHITHGTMGEILINSADSLVATLCISCHTPGGWLGMSKFFSGSQRAVPGVSGTSHAWNADTLNTEFGAQSPQTQTLLDHISPDGKITCATCHDPHSNTVSPFLRLDNSADALCLDCHRQRQMTSVRTYTGNKMSHPVGVTIPSSDTTYHNPPLDTDGNPQPSDGNTTNDYQFGPGGVLQCTTCHGVHYTDSNSGTVDGP
jgi:predicted CXXCH cytochrome family protein